MFEMGPSAKKSSLQSYLFFFNNSFLRKRGMASNLKMEYQDFLCIFQKNSAMATLCLKEMEKFLSEGREKSLPCWLSLFNKTKQPTGQFFSLPFQMNLPISFKPKEAIAKFIGKMQKKSLVL